MVFILFFEFLYKQQVFSAEKADTVLAVLFNFSRHVFN